MKYNILETLIGFIFLVTALTILFMLVKKQNTISKDEYVIYATCDNVDGIISGSDLKIAGVNVGVVDSIILNYKTYSAKVKILLQNNVIIPNDSTFSISSSGLLGSKFIAIEPGISETLLKHQDLVYLKAAMNIESVINQLINSFASKAATN